MGLTGHIRVTRGTDCGRDRGEIPGSSESGSAVEKETHGRSIRDFPVQGRAEREQAVYRGRSDEENRTPDEVYFGTCNRQTMVYSKPRDFTPISL